MPDTTISQLPLASAAHAAVVAADSADGTTTSKVTLSSIASLGGGPPAAHASSHATGGADVITPSSIGAVASNDLRLTNSRDPNAHKSTHSTGGVDALTAADIGAASATHSHTLLSITDAGTAAGKNVPASGNATATQVVLGSDTRLTDSRSPSPHASTHRVTGADYPAPVCVSPASLATNQNDWSPGTADVLYVSSSADINITGLLASSVDGFQVLVININASGGSKITLKNESSASAASNRFKPSTGGDIVLYANGGSAALIYHAASSRWRVL